MSTDSVLFLYTELMGYTEATMRSLAQLADVDVVAVCSDQHQKRGYKPESSQRIRFLRRSEHDAESLTKMFREQCPRLVFVSGWRDSAYLQVARAARRAGVPVVSGMDNQWHGTLRQRAACVLAGFRLRPYFSHLQVAGVYQYEFARRLGFPRNKILFDQYAADTQLFGSELEDRSESFARRFLYVGRNHADKGLDVLDAAWEECHAKSDWELVLIGDEKLRAEIRSGERVSALGFQQPHDLAREAARGGVMLLPSRWEPWGVVVHELAALGMPLIVSDACGAATEFLIPGYNGMRFATGDAQSLARCMITMSARTDDELRTMGARSRSLAGRISSETSAASLLSVLYES